MGIKRMSKDAEQRILRAVSTVAELVADGAAPNPAIIKVASELQLPAGHVRLVVNAYNIGQTTLQRKTAEDTLGKAADFELADAAVVLEALYPDVASERQKAASAVVSDDYELAPLWYRRRQAEADRSELLEPLSKAAAVAPCNRIRESEDTAGHLKRAYNAVVARQRALEEERRLVSAVQDRLLAGFDKLAEYFQTPGGLAYRDVLENAETLFGKTATILLTKLAEFYPELVKRAGRGSVHACPVDRDPYRTIGQLVDWGTELAARDQAYTEKIAAAYAEFGGQLAEHQRSDSLLAGIVEVKQAAGVAPAFGGALSATLLRDLVGTIGSTIRNPDNKAQVQKQLAAISSPEHEQQLSDIRTQSMLGDLLSDEEISRAYSPLEVANLYNDMSQIAPTAATQPMLVRSLLKKHLAQSSVDPFEVEQLVSTEGKLRNIDKGQPSAPAAGFPA